MKPQRITRDGVFPDEAKTFAPFVAPFVEFFVSFAVVAVPAVVTAHAAVYE